MGEGGIPGVPLRFIQRYDGVHVGSVEARFQRRNDVSGSTADEQLARQLVTSVDHHRINAVEIDSPGL